MAKRWIGGSRGEEPRIEVEKDIAQGIDKDTGREKKSSRISGPRLAKMALRGRRAVCSLALQPFIKSLPIGRKRGSCD
jgi:hypothetical protein